MLGVNISHVMGINVQQRGGKHQLRVRHRLLPKAFFFTFATEAEAETYGQQMQALLDRGIVPSELLAPTVPGGDDPLIEQIIVEYMRHAPITGSDDALLMLVYDEVRALRLSALTFKWAEGYVSRLKQTNNVAPSTIRKRVGALGRVIDWHIARSTPAHATPRANVMRMLPRGYSIYSKHDAAALGDGKVVRRDVQRDRRLGPGEAERIAAALAGVKRADRERPYPVDPAFRLLYELIVDTGLRLLEAYRLTVADIDLKRGLIDVQGSKGHRGEIRPRTVPLKPVLVPKLKAWCGEHKGLLFPYWDGTPEDRPKCSARLSARFATLFDYAEVPDFTEHDLRHEATCRWIQMRSADGKGWMWSDVEIARIMGWTDLRMMLRYASLRGEDLAARMRG